jgi:tetratricopeptide (TPR) repeat protein
VRGELDWIVMKCLEKDRGRRYETASAFAADVQRYLADEAVLACPPSAGYRFRKFARRNKRALATAAVLAAAMLTVMGTLGWVIRDREANTQEAARERATREAAIQAEVTTALNEAERWQALEDWPEALSAVKRAEGFLAGGGDGVPRGHVLQLRNDLEMVLRLEEIRLRSSEIKDNKFDWETADGAYARAFADYGIDILGLPVEEAASRIRARPGVAVALIVALYDWAGIHNTQNRAGGVALRGVAQAADPDPWRRQVRQAVEQKDNQALAALVDSPEFLHQPPASMLIFATFLRSRGLAEVEVLRRAQRQYPGDFWINYKLALSLKDMGPSHRAETVSFWRAALAVRPQSAAAHNSLAINLAELGNLDEAVACDRKAIELDPAYANAHNSLGNTLRKQGKPDEAVVRFKKAIELAPRFTHAHINLASVLMDQGKLDEAVAALHEALRLEPAQATIYFLLGEAYARSGRWDKAAGGFALCLELDPRNHYAWLHAAAAYLAAGEAAGYRRTCREMLERFGPCDDPQFAERTAKVCSLAPAAVADFRRVELLAERAVTGTEGHRFYRQFVLAKGLADYRAGRHAEALKWLERFAPDARGVHWDASAYAVLAMVAHTLGQADRARAALASGRKILTDKLSPLTEGRPFGGGSWPDWLHAQLLCHEADLLLKGSGPREGPERAAAPRAK